MRSKYYFDAFGARGEKMIFGKRYTLTEEFGITEKPLQKCPTYIIRDKHKRFNRLINGGDTHIVIYGASRQGKSWLVEKYTPRFKRIGCDYKSTRETLFKSMLNELGIKVGNITEASGNSTKLSLSATGEIETPSVPFMAKAKVATTASGESDNQTSDTIEYINIDLENQSEVISALKDKIDNYWIVIENFHYLKPEIQKAFANSMRDFLYYGIKVIIIGIWKDATKITSMIPDLTGRVESIDIGEWDKDELEKIIKEGSKALNIRISKDIRDQLITRSGKNVGIFKALLRNLCSELEIDNTQGRKIKISDLSLADNVIKKTYMELVNPAIDRLHNLARTKKSGSKGMRFFIIKSLCQLINELSEDELITGIPYNRILSKFHSIEDAPFDDSNIRQELLILHTREDTDYELHKSYQNYIPLFYFDKVKDKLYIVDSAIIAAKGYMKHEQETLTKVIGAIFTPIPSGRNYRLSKC